MATISSINIQDSMDQETIKAHIILWNQTLSFIKSMSLNCAIELRIPDAIHRHGMPATISDLISSLSIPEAKSRSLRILLRILCLEGIFKSHITLSGEEAFDLTNVSRLLITSSVPNQQLDYSNFILLNLDHRIVDSYHQLSHWFHRLDVTTTSFEMAHGKPFWVITKEQPTFNDLFNKGMLSDSSIVAHLVINMGVEAFKGIETLVDVGGGTGLMAMALVEAIPSLKCTIFDLPNVINSVEKKMDNIQYVAGDMFVEVPSADVILLKWILHDWNDEDCVKILQRCKEAIPPKDKGGKVIIIDMVVGVAFDTQSSMETQLLVDLHMITLVMGKERNESEWRKIFFTAGFSDYKITTSIGLSSIIELYL